MMIVFHGRRLYGRIDQADGSSIATLFFYIQFLPLVPLSSHLVLAEKGGQTRAIPIPMDWRSVLAGYVRAWGIPVTFALVVAALFATTSTRPRADASPILTVVEAVIAVAVLAAAHALFGRLGKDAKAQRAVHKRWVGYAVDPALLGEARDGLAKRLRKELVDATPKNPGNYREVAPPKVNVRKVALDPNVLDRDYLERAFTLARLQESLAEEASKKRKIGRDRAAIWAKLQAR